MLVELEKAKVSNALTVVIEGMSQTNGNPEGGKEK